MSHYEQRQLEVIASKAAARKVDSTRHKCFVSYHAADTAAVATFLDDFGTEFIAKTVGVTDEDDFIDSDDTDYIMSQIRMKYLGDSTVTIALMGACTWARRYVDWEIYSSLRASKHSSVNGLLAIQLPTGGALQARIGDNVSRDANGSDVGYAQWNVYPRSAATLRSWISDAYSARATRKNLIDNTRQRRLKSASC